MIAEAHLDPDSIFAGVQRFAQERPKRLSRQRALLNALGMTKELTMLIVDAQIHLWNAGNPTSPWHRQVPAY